MRILLRRYESQGGGQRVAIEHAIEADRLTIGRGTGAHVLLPDLRVALAHAELRMRERDAWLVEATGRNTVWVAGAPAALAELGPGDSFELGRFRLTLGTPPPGTDLLLTVEELYGAREEKARRQQDLVMTLAHSGWRKRRPALLLAGGILLLGLVLPPLLRSLAPGDTAAASLDRIWQAGPPSHAHAHFVRDCAICHRRPFVRTENAACLACHAGQAQHSDTPALLALDEFGAARCGSCHVEHAGDALVARSPDLCVDCHADPGDFPAAHKLQASARFGDAHPAFSVSLPRWREDGAPWREEVELTATHSGLREESNLRFPHGMHLDPAGVNAPDGPRVLACADCHVPAGRGFAPIAMLGHCSDCHRLHFDPQRTERLVPHAEPAQVVKTIRDHYARVALAGEVPEAEAAAPAIVRRPRPEGAALTREEAQAALGWAESRAALAIDEVFERRLCGQCHVVERTGQPELPWKVRPVALTAHFLKGARFDHAAHRTQDCGDCHQAARSAAATDVMIPPIATCRECHGDPGVAGKVPSACVDCHGFHIAREAVFDRAAQ